MGTAIRILGGLVVLLVLLAACTTAQTRPLEALEVKQAAVNGIELAYVEEGSGDTVVFVHGAMGDWHT